MIFTPAQHIWVYKFGEKKQFFLLFETQLCTSEDLREWKPGNESFLPVGDQSSAYNTTECPNYFEWNGLNYIIMGRSGFWMSKEEAGNYWEGKKNQNKNVKHPRWDIFDGLMVPMVSSFKGNRRLLAGFTGGYGGHLVFRELIQHSDGTLGMKWPEEMIPPSGSPLKWEVKVSDKGVFQTSNSIKIKATQLSRIEIVDIPLSYRLTTNVVPKGNVKSFGIQFNGIKKDQVGCELRLEPKGQHAQWGTFKEDSVANFVPHESDMRSPYAVAKGYNFSLKNVEGLNEPFKLDIIVKYDPESNIALIDACIDDRRTMITRRYDLKCKSITLFAVDGEVDFKNVVISPIIQ